MLVKNLKLPISASQPADIGRLWRELNLINEHLNQEAIKKNKKAMAEPTLKLKELLDFNNLSLASQADREELLKWLNDLKTSAPLITISFSSEASKEVVEKIAEWFRKEIDPLCLISIGLQPNIGVGSVVRTTNKVFDLSLRSRLEGGSQLLIEELKKL